MKKYILLSSVLFSSILCLANDKPAESVNLLKAGGGWNFQITGKENSAKYINALFSNFPETKKKGYVWKFKNIEIDGIDHELTFQVHKGISGKKDNGAGYFHTFTSEKYKNQLLANQQQNESEALIIYVKDGRKHPLKSMDEATLVKDYLMSLLG